MKLSFQNTLGGSPYPYIRHVLQACGQRRPPICERTILDYLDLTVDERLPDDAPAEIHDALRDCCSLLNRERKAIWIYPHRSRRSKRSNKLHEATHFICPTHTAVNVFACDDGDTTTPGYKRQEQEAFGGASAFLMPVESFVPDILSTATSWHALDQLHDRYDAPLEVTAIWYARMNPRLCAVVMVEPNIRAPETASTLSPCHGQRQFSWDTSAHPTPQPADVNNHWYRTQSGILKQLPHPNGQYPLRVRYADRSARFPCFIRPGTGISAQSVIFKAWHEQQPMRDEVPAATFGASGRWGYHAECIPLGTGGKVLVLLWLKDQQLSLKLFT